jgi:hypothetical protein
LKVGKAHPILGTLAIADLGRHRVWGIEQGARSQNPEFRRKAGKIDFI